MAAIIRFLLYTSLFAASCALSLCMATEKLVLDKLPPLLTPLHALCIGGCLLIYNVHYLGKRPSAIPRTAWTAKHRGWNIAFAILGVFLCVVSTFSMPVHVLEGYLLLAVLSSAYSLPLLPVGGRGGKRLKEFGVLKPFLLAGVWTVVTTLLPILFWHALPTRYPVELLLRFLFIFALCVAFDVRDLSTDVEDGIFTLPYRLGLRRADTLMRIALLAFAVLAIVQYFRYPSLWRLLGEWIAAAYAYWAIKAVRKRTGDAQYLLWVDGAMLVYGILLLLNV